MEPIHKLDGRCHCGNIRYRYYTPTPRAGLTVRACTCSFCCKNGARYSADPHAVLVAEVFDCDAIHLYRFGTQTADFYVCSRCGIAPFVTWQDDRDLYALVNVNTLDPCATDPLAVESVCFEHEDLDQRCRRRRRTWIGNVTLTMPARRDAQPWQTTSLPHREHALTAPN